MKIIMMLRIEYRKKHKNIEQQIRSELVNEKEREEYTKQLYSDCKKLLKRHKECKKIILDQLGIPLDIYEEQILKIGNEKSIEHELYLEHIQEAYKKVATKEYEEKANKIKKEYTRQESLAVNYLALHAEFRKKAIDDILGQKDIRYLSRMIALDSMFDDYNLTNLEYDIMTNGADNPYEMQF